MSVEPIFREEHQGLRESVAGLLAGLGLIVMTLATILGAVLLLYYEHPSGFQVALASTRTPGQPTAAASPWIVTATPFGPVATLPPGASPSPTYWTWPTALPASPEPWPPTYPPGPRVYPTSTTCPPPLYRYWLYTVRSGETLAGIAWRFSTSADRLIQINCLSSTRIYVGQRLRIPGYPPTVSPAPTHTPVITVIWPTITPSPTPGIPTVSPTSVTPSPTAETPVPPTPTVPTVEPTTEPPTPTTEAPTPTPEAPTPTPPAPTPVPSPTTPPPTEPPPPTQPPPTPTTAPLPTQPPPPTPTTAPLPTAPPPSPTP